MANKLLVTLAIFFVWVDFVRTDCPSGIYESGLSQEDRDYIVSQHNYLRGQVASGKVPDQPKATNMKQISYSMELEKKAQEVANTCEFKHVPITGTSWGWVGQNLFLFLSTEYGKGPNWHDAIQYWFDEHKKYKFGSPFSEETGHYTQLVWADTDHAGCGYAHYKKPSGDYSYQKLYVCNYGPGGNVNNQSPYKT
ncbi:venom allergen 5-like [Coccinella septempunctata]|uniref:venom allergen 5-like n=1 Tax=Coccinella septempunctata TaxID=41139 RepID=UPI001D0956FC|nr:venom allergen 5-like [Coccinella septempunctata]